MQRTFVVITLAALALTGVMGADGYTASSYVKAPASVAENNETNFTNTNTTSTLGLASITTGQVYLTATNYTSNKENISNFGWNVYAKKLEAKALTAASPLIYNFNSTNDVIYVNSYAIGFASETESAITNLKIYQVPLTTTGGAGAPLPKLTYTNNTNGTTGAFAPSYVTNIAIGKVVYVFYKSAEKTVSIASFTVGGTLSTTNTVLTTNYTDGSLQVVWGESLGTSKLLAVWNEGATLLKDATVDLTKTNVTANTVEGYTSSHTCYAYATDKTLYGEICTAKNDTDPEPKNRTITYSVRTTNNGSKLVNFTTFAYSGNPSYVANYAYGPYLIFDFANNTVSNATTNEYQYFYEIWNFDNSSLCRPRTLYLQINQTATTAQNFRVVSGGLYTLFYDKAADKDSTLTNVQVGLLLGSSNLASVLGFLLTIIAGLLLF